MQFMWLHTRFKEQTSIWVSNDIKVFLRIFMESVKRKRVIFQNGYLATFNARLLQQTRTTKRNLVNVTSKIPFEAL